MLPSPKDRETLLNAIKELSDSMTRVDAEKDFQKDVLAGVVEKLEIKKTMVSKLANVYHKQTYSKVQEESEQLETLYEELFAGN